MRIGILMGGPSREREIAFAGGRTVFDNLDRSRFTPVPLLVDGLGGIVLLDWPYLYRGTLRDFFPPPHLLGQPPYPAHIDQLGPLDPDRLAAARHQIGAPIDPAELPLVCDLIFTTLHGPWGEDGTLQGLCQWLGLPYTGAGIAGSALGIDKIAQRRWMQQAGFPSPRFLVLDRAAACSPQAADQIAREVGFPCVVKHPTQGSSIGVALAHTAADLPDALDAAFLRRRLDPTAWRSRTPADRFAELQRLTDLRYEVGLPAWAEWADGRRQPVESPHALAALLDSETEAFELVALDAPDAVLVEEFIPGDEFSVIVLETPEGRPLALPPTRIQKSGPVFDYRGKYLAGAASKQTPMPAPSETMAHLLRLAEELQQAGDFGPCARLDGILGADGVPYFNDPNTTSGMLPSSFLFHQAAEVGLSPTALLTCIIEQSLRQRRRSPTTRPRAEALLEQIGKTLSHCDETDTRRQRVGVVLGGFSTERHIAVESGRNAWQKLLSSEAYEPVPLFLLDHRLLYLPQKAALGLKESDPPFGLWELPLPLLLKDNADDIARQVAASIGTPHERRGPLAQQYERAAPLRDRYATAQTETPRFIPFSELARHVDLIFNTAHGRPGEDGTLAAIFEELGLPHNGCDPAAASLTMDKAATNAALDALGFRTPRRRLLCADEWTGRLTESLLQGLTRIADGELQPWLVAKPNDEGCSSAVRRLQSPQALEAYLRLAFRQAHAWDERLAQLLDVRSPLDFPAKDEVLLEEWIGPQAGSRLMEITVGFYTEYAPDGGVVWQVFEPSQTEAQLGLLTLEEKFLAGEGLNRTPAPFADDPDTQERISAGIRSQVAAAMQGLGVTGYGRVDAFVRIDAGFNFELIFIEVNTLPGFTPATVLFHQAARAGLRPIDLMEKILSFGRERAARQQALA